MELLLAICAAAGFVWLAVIFWRGGLIGGALVVLLAGCCFGHPFFNVPAGPAPLTADRLLLAVLIVQYAVYRRLGWTQRLPLSKTDYLLGAFLLALFVSTLTHDFNGGQPLARLAFFYLIPTAVYWIMRQARATRESTLWVFGSLGALGIYLALTAVAETHQQWDYVFPRYIGSTEFREFLGRGRGPFLNPVANGIAMTLGMCAALMSWPRLNRPGKLLLLALLPVFAWGVYNTFTRSVWMGASASLVLVVALATPRSWRVATLATTALIGASVLAVSWGQFVAFKRDRDVSVEDVAESAKLRPILAAVAWQMFLDRPLVGCGFGQYAQESRPYLADRTTDLPLEKSRPYVQHNVFLAPLVETGLVGLSLFVALLASWLHTAWRLWRAAWAPTWVRQMGLLFLAFMPAYLVNGMFHDVSIISQVNMLLFFLAGGISGLTPWLEAPLDPKPLRVWKPEDELVTA